MSNAQVGDRTLTRIRAAIVAVLGLMAGCQDAEYPVNPNRALDRPLDAAITCAKVKCDEDDQCSVVMLALSECEGEEARCDDFDKLGSEATEGSPQLIGYVANSERNELAVFRQCDNRLVDLDVDVPGYNFLPVGELPSALAVSEYGCRVTSVNRGVHSCDLSVVDGRGVAAMALRVGEADSVVESSLVSRLQPLTYRTQAVGAPQWQPLGTRPGEIVSVPSPLSTSATIADTPVPDEPIEDQAEESACLAGAPGSVYVSFPSCDLVAEIDLVSHRILQSVQLQRQSDGTIFAADTGASPVCPIDCPSVLEGGGGPSGSATLPPGELAISAMALVSPADTYGDLDPTVIPDSSLFVAGYGSDLLIEIPIDDDGVWDPVGVRTLEVVGSGGIERIRPTPTMKLSVLPGGEGDDYQFLYLVAGDGSTRVVKRDLDALSEDLGDECDTQIDPAAADSSTEAQFCAPVAEAEGRLPLERRPFARGPGIRPLLGGRITDWLFKKQLPESETADGAISTGGEGNVVGVGVSSTGAIHNTVFTAVTENDSNQLTPTQDPVGLFDVSLRAHMLMPSVKLSSEPTAQDLPAVEDAPPVRRIDSGASHPTRMLSPRLRRVDGAYATRQCVPSDDDVDPPAVCLTGFAPLDNQMFGEIQSEGEPEFGYYNQPVVRAVAPDKRSWYGGVWRLEWEGRVPGTESTSGQLHCENPSWDGGACLPLEAGDAKLVDPTATFCSDGVVRGDKVVIAACTRETGCPQGQRCLTNPRGNSETGICVSERDFEDRAPTLRNVCADFIDDPCGPVHLEYLITHAYQNELWLQALDRPAVSVLPAWDPNATAAEVPADRTETDRKLVCTETQPDGGCTVDQDCAAASSDGTEVICFEGKCRYDCPENPTPDDPKGCMLRRLPGPACFEELVAYSVRARASFVVRGPGRASFLHDRVRVAPDGQCVELAPDDLSVSPLLTSRIKLGPTDQNLGLPPCEEGVPPQFAPNPCVIQSPQMTAAGASRFHYLSVVGRDNPAGESGPVTAVRYSNPGIQLVLDLTSIPDLTWPIPGSSFDEPWPLSSRAFHRSRIPRGYFEQFETDFAPRESTSTVFGPATIQPLTLPVRIIQGPGGHGFRGVYIVDSSGPGTSDVYRGQVVRMLASQRRVDLDPAFDGVH
ncbi:MAG: hypothetical protein B7733_17715 [Myxococcales bacterium FL481]|nr:MAG: hypothetical protein B7733_17715 [Myxococcales bacterium FL481]